MTEKQTGIQVRGYTVLKSAEYLRNVAGESEGRRIIEGFSPALQQALRTASAATWLPVAHVSEVFRAIAERGQGDEARARQLLTDCGTYLGTEATNTFLRLVMRMLTPALFAKKLPSFWARDATGGRYDVDVTEQKLVCRLLEMEQFEHIAPISLGYVSFALRAMGKTIERADLHGWSLATPSPPAPWFELHWRK